MSFYDPCANVQRVTLPNGLSVFVEEREAPWVYVGFVVHVGAREDPVGRNGLAHLVEHLVSENVEDYTSPELKRRLKSLGGNGMFGSINYLSTSYRFFLPDHLPALDEALSLFGSMLLTAQLTRAIEEEKVIIGREFHLQYPHVQEYQWQLQASRALFVNHPSLTRYDTALGSLEEMSQCRQEELQAFYDQYYVPANISVVSVGHVSLEQIVQALQRSPFGRAKRGQRNQLPAPFSVLPPSEPELRVSMGQYMTLPLAQAQCTFTWVLPVTVEMVHVWLLRTLLEAQLTNELRHQRQLVYGVEVCSEYYQDCRTLSIDLEVPAEAIGMTKDLLWQVLSLQDAHERFEETKTDLLNQLLRPDYSGLGLIRAIMHDLETFHRLVSIEEERQAVANTSFADLVQLASWLTAERLFSFLIVP